MDNLRKRFAVTQPDAAPGWAMGLAKEEDKD